MKKQLLFAFGAAALLASCSNDIDSPVANVNDGYLKVNGSIGGVQTRMDGTEFKSGDQIGVNVTDGDQNVSYTYTTAFAPTGEGIKVSDEIQVSAYYPYTATLTENAFDFSVVDDQKAPKAAKDADLLFAKAVTVKPESATANFQFAHVNSQISLNLVDKTSDKVLESATTLSISLNNVAVNGTFNTITGVVTPKTANGTITIASPSTTAANVVIVPSYATDNQNEIQVVVKVNDVTYTGKIKPVLKAANRYNYNLNINDPEEDETEVDLDITGTIGSWTDNTGGGADQNGDVDVDPDYVLAVGDYLLKDGTTIAGTKSNATAKKDEIVGVVYYVGNPQPSELYSEVDNEHDVLKKDFPNATHGLAVAVENVNGETAFKFFSDKTNLNDWMTANESNDYGKDIFKGIGFNSSTTPTQMLGYNYTTLLKRASNNSSTNFITVANDLLTNLENFNTTYKVTGASDWYVPSYAEFALIQDKYVTISTSFSNLDDKDLPQYEGESTPTNKNFYWVSDYRSNGNQWISVLNTLSVSAWMTPNSGNMGWVRPAIAF